MPIIPFLAFCPLSHTFNTTWRAMLLCPQGSCFDLAIHECFPPKRNEAAKKHSLIMNCSPFSRHDCRIPLRTSRVDFYLFPTRTIFSPHYSFRSTGAYLAFMEKGENLGLLIFFSFPSLVFLLLPPGGGGALIISCRLVPFFFFGYASGR